MKLLVIGAGLMGSAAAYDMARNPRVERVTLADADLRRAKDAAKRLNKLNANKKIVPLKLDASKPNAAARLMKGHAGTLSAVPYFFNVGLSKAAIEAKSHFCDLGGNNVVVRKTLAMSKQAAKRGVALAPDCGLSPGMASILAGELMRRVAPNSGDKVDALKIYVGGLPQNAQPPFYYQMVFSIEGLINEYVEPARVLRKGKIEVIEPLSETERFEISGYEPLVAFHTSGGTSTLPETFSGRVGECFEKTLRHEPHFNLIRSLYDLGFFSSQKRKVGKAELTPRQLTSQIFLEKFSGNEPDVTIMRVEAHKNGKVAAFEMIDRFDPATGMTSMMRTTAWPAAIVLQMLCEGTISKHGAIYQETDVPGRAFLAEMERRGIELRYVTN
jgi:lysine 6-dehydrogenase